MRYFATLSLVAFAAVSFAQVGPPPPMGGAGQGGPGQMGSAVGRGPGATRTTPSSSVQTETIRLLGLNSVQNDLGLTLSEWTALNKTARSLKSSTVTEEQALEAVSKNLTAAQVGRLKELLVQDLGYGSLALADVRSRLDLTAEQTTQIETILTALQTAKNALPSGSGSAATQKALKDLQTQSNSQLAKVLTADQDAKLRALAGKAL